LRNCEWKRIFLGRKVCEAIKAGWIRIETVKQDPLVRVMQRDLDKGEAEAIALAIQVNAGWVLMGERDGRKAARSMKLKVVGVLGILLKARRKGRLMSLKQAMDRLRDKAGFYTREDLYSEIIRECNKILRPLTAGNTKD